MTILVPARPPATPSPALASPRVRCGVAVSARDFYWLASAIAYARGRGCVLVPGSASPNYSVPASGTRTLRWRAYQRYPCIQRLYVVRMHRATMVSGESTVVTLKAPTGGTAQAFSVSGITHISGTTCWLLEDAVTQFEGEVDISLDIINGSASTAITVDATTVIELPRVSLAGGGSEHGADPNTDLGGEPIFYGAAGESVGGAVDGYKGLAGQTTRGSLYAWSVDDANALTTTSTSDVDLFQPAGVTTGNPKVRTGYPCKQGRSATTKTVQVRARLKVSGAGVGGRILVTTRLGATATLTCTVGATSFAWYTGTLVMDCESMSSSDGRQSGASEELSIVWKNTNTAGTVSCSALCVIDG